MSANLFAREPDSMETVIATVQRSALEEQSALGAGGGLVRTVAAEAVAYYWPRPIRLYIPVLALREVRAWLRDQPPMTAAGEARPLHLVLAAHRFVAARPDSDSGNPDFQQAAVEAAEAWCGTIPEQARARSAFVQVVSAICADGTAASFDPARYVMLAAEVLATPESQPDAADKEEVPGRTGPVRDGLPSEESEA